MYAVGVFSDVCKQKIGSIIETYRKDVGISSKIPHFNTLLNYRKHPLISDRLTRLLHQIHASIADQDPNLMSDSIGKTTDRKKF